MTKFAKMLSFAVLAGLIGMTFGGCSNRAEDQAKARFQDYMNAFHERNYHRAWELMSPSLKSQNGNESEFTSYTKAQNIGIAGFAVQKVDIKGPLAIITVDITASDLPSNKVRGTDREACTLSLNQGLWYFDICKLPNSISE